MIQLPQQFRQRMKELLGKEYDAYLRSMEQPPVRALRVNTQKISTQDFLAVCPFELSPIPYADNGFYFAHDKIGNHPFHHAGMIYVQEPAAMAPAACVEIDANWRVLDLCAAPGGKSTQIGNQLGPNGVLVSNEIVASRCKILTGNIERLGLHNVITTCLSPEKAAEVFPETFDMIMVDAPCSGEGMFRKEAAAVTEWSQANVEMCAKRQADILDRAASMLKSGGKIVYATCTFSLEENEMAIDAFLKRHPNFSLVPVSQTVKNATVDGIAFDGCACQNIHEARRFYPHTSAGEGQFMAVLQHMGEATMYTQGKKMSTPKPDPILLDFLDETLLAYDKSHVTSYNEGPVYFTPNFSIPKGTAFCCGITIGQLRKNYIQPHHQFFMALGKQFKRKIDLSLDDPRLQAYLRGEEITVDCENGWAVVTLLGCPLGGVKVTNRIAKNHYPKGLRLNH